MTGVIDRLENAGLVQRERNVEDRRKIILRPLPNKSAPTGDLFNSIHDGTVDLLSSYSTKELQLVEKFTKDLITLMQPQIHKLREK